MKNKLLSLLLGGTLGLFCLTPAAKARFSGAAEVDAIIEQAIAEGTIPGAVLLIGHHGSVIYRKAYGYRSLVPRREKMTVNTIFDVASLTKSVATAPSIMKLFEEGKIRFNDRVTEYLPEFQGGNSRITVRHLFTHFSGLPPDLKLEPKWSGYETGIEKALIVEPVAEPGERFIYSDINYILLGEIVRRLSGETLPEFARKNFYKPLRMKDTMFLPPKSLRRRIAPTEVLPGHRLPLRGVVHDPTSRAMGGVAGHAGLFTTAKDLSHYAEMLLQLGRYRHKRVLRPLTVRKMTTPQSPADQPVLRGAGWDIDSAFSSNRGELFPLGSYGHTGYTGTSLWIDPASRTYIILLTNRVHPHDKGSVVSLRCRVATVTAARLGIEVPGVSLTGYNETLVGAGVRRRTARNGEVETGLDVLAEDGFAPLRGKRVGLITNQTGLSRNGKRNIDLMIAAGIKVTALLSPEHGIAGVRDTSNIANSTDQATGVPIFSLYAGKNRRPSKKMLRGVDVLVFDIQDVGARFYTYMCTMIYAMQEAAKLHLPFLVLDRPNPITGVHVEGPMLDPDLHSFVGCCSLPIRHGMTLGEIARMANSEQHIGANLKVIPMKGWQRGDWFDSTGLVWVNPSPNMRSLNAALLYPGLAMIEASRNYSVGRGTGSPFEQVGADWIHGRELAAYLNQRHIPGIRVYPTRFRPVSSRFAGRQIEGVRFVITDRERVDSVRLGLEVAAALEHLYPGRLQWEATRRLIGNHATIQALQAGNDPRAIIQAQVDPLRDFLKRRAKYLLYP